MITFSFSAYELFSLILTAILIYVTYKNKEKK